VDTETFELFFALLTVVALAGVVALNALRLAAHSDGAGGRLLHTVASAALPLAWLVALTCTLGSLYFSEVANFEPCKLCWFQRIFMYPLAIILGIAALRRDRGIRWYALPLAGVGICLSAYHYLIERFPDLDAVSCSAATPCTFVWFEKFGFVTLPFMALSGFALILTLLTLPTPRAQEI
jgi:disulfide bond formation protein DsbB